MKVKKARYYVNRFIITRYLIRRIEKLDIKKGNFICADSKDTTTL